MRAMRWIFGGLTLAATAMCGAAELSVHVVDDHGKPVADAVVTVLQDGTASGQPSKGVHAPTTRFIDQKSLTFIPYIEVFRPGDSVVFRNSDKTRHHVYSFSPIKTFEFMLVPGQSSPPLLLDKNGVIAVGCNIHDQMITYMVVSDAPWIAQSTANGQVAFHDLPAGAYSIHVWQPRLRPGTRDVVQSTALGGANASQSLAFKLSLLPDSRSDMDREHMSY